MNLAFKNNYFYVEHCDDCGINGHLILRPQQLATHLYDLSPEALQHLGSTLAQCYSILDKIIKPARIYTLSFCELMPSLHFHIFPRSEALSAYYNHIHNTVDKPINGALYFNWARNYCPSKTEDSYLIQQAINQAFTCASV